MLNIKCLNIHKYMETIIRKYNSPKVFDINDLYSKIIEIYNQSNDYKIQRYNNLNYITRIYKLPVEYKIRMKKNSNRNRDRSEDIMVNMYGKDTLIDNIHIFHVHYFLDRTRNTFGISIFSLDMGHREYHHNEKGVKKMATPFLNHHHIGHALKFNINSNLFKKPLDELAYIFIFYAYAMTFVNYHGAKSTQSIPESEYSNLIHHLFLYDLILYYDFLKTIPKSKYNKIKYSISKIMDEYGLHEYINQDINTFVYYKLDTFSFLLYSLKQQKTLLNNPQIRSILNITDKNTYKNFFNTHFFKKIVDPEYFTQYYKDYLFKKL